MLMTSANYYAEIVSFFISAIQEDCMLTSIAMILLLGLLIGWIFSRFKLPSLLGMVIV